MITAGCNTGSLTAKAVILKDGKMLVSKVIRASAQPEKSALGGKLHRAENPQINGAIGAAFSAMDSLEKNEPF